MKLPRLLRPTLAGALLLASQALEDIARRVAPKEPKAPPPRPRTPAPGSYRVTVTEVGKAMIAPPAERPAPSPDEPLAGSVEARRRAGAL